MHSLFDVVAVRIEKVCRQVYDRRRGTLNRRSANNREYVKIQIPPGYSALVAFDRTQHAGVGLDGAPGYGFASGPQNIYVTAAVWERVGLRFPLDEVMQVW